jgi:hypothetical protein
MWRPQTHLSQLVLNLDGGCARGKSEKNARLRREPRPESRTLPFWPELCHQLTDCSPWNFSFFTCKIKRLDPMILKSPPSTLNGP